MKLSELIAQFVDRIHYPGWPKSHPAGGVVFTFDRMDVVCREEGGYCLLQGEAGEMPEEAMDQESWLQRVLQASLARMAKEKVSLTLDPVSKAVLVYRRFSFENLAVSDFEMEVESFLNVLESWGRQVRRDKPAGAVPPEVLLNR